MQKHILVALAMAGYYTAQKMKFSVKDFFSKCDQIRSFLRIWSHLQNKSLMENFSFLVQCMVFWFSGFLSHTGPFYIAAAYFCLHDFF